MRIEALSIRAATIMIFVMIGIVASILSLFAGSYFRQAALDAQMNSLSRVIEVASREMLKEVRGYTFDLGMRLGHSEELVQALKHAAGPGDRQQLVALLDDPFINGFVGFSNINLEKIRVYDLDLTLVGESTRGIAGMEPRLCAYLEEILNGRPHIDRLKAVDALWTSPAGPLYSTLVPVGGLRLIGYLEIIINPVFNLPDIGKITNTPISIFSMKGEPIIGAEHSALEGRLPVEYVMPASDGTAAFRVIGHENVERLNAEMKKTQVIATSGFLVLTLGTLLFALWLFNRFLFVPVRRMVQDMQRMAGGELDLTVNKKGLRDFSMLAEAFDTMASQVRMRTGDLERLLDLDDSAILCFGADNEAVYMNRGAARLFGYATDETGDLDMGDLFSDDIAAMMKDAGQPPGAKNAKLHARLTCVGADGAEFRGDAVVSTLDVMGRPGYAIVLNPNARDSEQRLAEDVVTSFQKNEQRMNAVEQSLNSLLEMARTRPDLIAETPGTPQAPGDAGKAALREGAVNLMRAALTCWERDLGKRKLDLAEASGIWPVYIDKSTPTTRTLDRYLNIESCPRNPRTGRVIETAEFVLRQAGDTRTAARRELQRALDDFRLLTSGMKPPAG